MKTRITNYQEQQLAVKLIYIWRLRAISFNWPVNERMEFSILGKTFFSMHPTKNPYIACEEWCLSEIHPDPHFPEIISTGYYLTGSEEVFKNDMMMLKMCWG